MSKKKRKTEVSKQENGLCSTCIQVLENCTPTDDARTGSAKPYRVLDYSGYMNRELANAIDAFPNAEPKKTNLLENRREIVRRLHYQANTATRTETDYYKEEIGEKNENRCWRLRVSNY